MIDGLFIIQRKSGVLLYEKMLESSKIDADLFSSLLTAIRAFSAEIHMGELTSFTTQNKTLLISQAENATVAVMLKGNASIDEWQGKAYEIGKQFNEAYDVSAFNGNRSQFVTFNETVDLILNQKSDSLVIQVAKWAGKEFGGDIHVQQTLINSTNTTVPIDIIIDKGELKDLRKREKLINKFFPGYNRDITFIKIFDERASQNDVEQFIETCKDFGYECSSKERCEKYFDYFPSKVIILARNFSPLVSERLEEITKKEKRRKKHYIQSNHLTKHAKFKSIGSSIFNCYIELWKWKEPYPERIFS